MKLIFVFAGVLAIAAAQGGLGGLGGLLGGLLGPGSVISGLLNNSNNRIISSAILKA